MIPVYWLARPGIDVRTRWDERFVELIIEGAIKHPAGLREVEHRIGVPQERQPFGVVAYPAGAHHPRDLAWLHGVLRNFAQVILIVTSDEGGTFRPAGVNHPNIDLWVMQPRPETAYPPGTTFFGVGAGAVEDGPALALLDTKTLGWFYAGQGNTERRRDCVDTLSGLPDGEAVVTETFMAGYPRPEYLEKLASARVAPCPSGFVTQDTFRLYEALELGCVPVVDELRNDGGGRGYWDMIDPDRNLLRVEHWDEFPALLKEIEASWPIPAVKAHAWWHRERRRLSRRLMQQCPPDEWGRSDDGVVDELTVVMPTSPIPAHPSIDVIAETLQSIRSRTDAEILIMVDGVRPEQQDRSGDYYEYVRRLLLHCERDIDNVTPVVFWEHLHQAEMLRRTLHLVDAPFLLYVEHDTPLCGEIPFAALLAEMYDFDLNTMRFSHESRILEVHEHLLPSLEPRGVEEKWVPTVQWSQRPHLGRLTFYRDLMSRYFDPSARTMIEDVMHGITEDAAVHRMKEGWEEWRMAVYHPEGNIQRSLHLDGRGRDTKYPMAYAYPGGVTPAGAPSPA